jgi:SAM-dependent methyltransferase
LAALGIEAIGASFRADPEGVAAAGGYTRPGSLIPFDLWNGQMIASVKLIKGFFPATAMPDSDWSNTLWPDPAKVLATLGVDRGMDVVDLCCGNGLCTAPLARMAGRVVAIEIDPRMLDMARAKVASNCTFIEGDAYEVSKLESWSADLVLIANTFHGVPDKERMATAVAVALKPGGRFVVVNWHLRACEGTVVLGEPRGPITEMRMTPGDVTAVVEPAGLRLSRVVELPQYHYGAILVKSAN